MRESSIKELLSEKGYDVLPCVEKYDINAGRRQIVRRSDGKHMGNFEAHEAAETFLK